MPHWLNNSIFYAVWLGFAAVIATIILAAFHWAGLAWGLVAVFAAAIAVVILTVSSPWPVFLYVRAAGLIGVVGGLIVGLILRLWAALT